jgi:hypothetical protein
MSVSRQVTVLIAAMALLTAGCGPWAPPLPTAPSAAGTATISGTVTGLTQSARLSKPGFPFLATALAALDAVTLATPVRADSGVTVTVVGTNISVVLSGSGKFVLTDVPVGNIQLRFSGAGTDAVLTINGVGNEHVQLVVKLEGSTAKLESFNRIQAGNTAELEGLITSISYGDRSMRVANVEVKVKDVPVRHGSTIVPFNDVMIGQRVHVKGTMENNHVVAIEVLLQNVNPPPVVNPPPAPPNPGPSDGDDGPRVEFRGFLSGFGGIGSCPSVSFTVDGRAVTASSATSFRHGPCEHLENGTWVEVNGLRQGNGTVLADKIEMKEREFTGMITSMSSGCPTLTLGIQGFTVKTYGWTKFEKLACGGFVTGLRVEVKGTEHPNGIVKAIRLKYEGEN